MHYRLSALLVIGLMLGIFLSTTMSQAQQSTEEEETWMEIVSALQAVQGASRVGAWVEDLVESLNQALILYSDNDNSTALSLSKGLAQQVRYEAGTRGALAVIGTIGTGILIIITLASIFILGLFLFLRLRNRYIRIQRKNLWNSRIKWNEQDEMEDSGDE